MNNNKILQSIKEDLEKEGLDCFIECFDSLLPKKLLIYTGEDTKKRTQLIEIKVYVTELQQKFSQDTPNAVLSVQIDAFFPFIVEDVAMPDVAQFLHFLNLQVEVPGFYLNYLDNKILYRHVLLSENDHVPKRIVMSLIGLSIFFQDVFGETLERLAGGQASFIDLMQEIQQVLAKATIPDKS